ncbi:unnamed protein product, partial [Thlaspi arvense]
IERTLSIIWKKLETGSTDDCQSPESVSQSICCAGLLGRQDDISSNFFLPLCGLELCKYGDGQLDECHAAGYTWMALPADSLVDGLNVSRIPLAAECLGPRSLYVYDNGFRMISPDIAMNLLGGDFATYFSRGIVLDLNHQH